MRTAGVDWLRSGMAGLAAAAALLAVAAPSLAQGQFPVKPVRLVVPFAASSAAALLAREVAQGVEPRLGQPVVVEARPGGNSLVGANFVAKSPADGYTLLFAASSATSAARALFKEVPYDPINDFATVIIYQEVYFTLVAAPGERGQSLAQFLDKMKRTPALNSLGGTGSATEIISKMIDTAGKTSHTYARYRDSSNMIVDVMGGRLGAALHTVTPSIQMLKTGQMAVLGVSSPVPLKSLPGVATFNSIMPDVVLGTFNGYFAPSRTPRAAINTLYRHFADVFRQPEILAKSEASGRPLSMNPEEGDAYVRSEQPRWERLAKLAGIEPE